MFTNIGAANRQARNQVFIHSTFVGLEPYVVLERAEKFLVSHNMAKHMQHFAHE
jgi:hypothetical protein